MAKELDPQTEKSITAYLGSSLDSQTITEISRVLSIGRNTVAKYLELLKYQGLVEQRIVGQAKLWSLTHTPFNSDKYGFSIRNLEGRHLYSYGAKSLSQFGFNEDTFNGKTTAEVLGDNYRDVDEMALQTVQTGQPSVCKKVYNTGQAKGEVVQYFFPNMGSDGKIQGTIGFATVSQIE
jgi:DNA-binding transcriptional MocR family regulator